MQHAQKVSVIIPTYNRADVLGRAISSVLAQTHQDFELIVVDDGSTDGSEQAVWAFDDKRIRYLRHDVNRGAEAALNTGLLAARGEYIAFLDSDDEWLPQKLHLQLDCFHHTGLAPLGVVLCWMVMHEGNTEVIHMSRLRGWVFQDLLGFDKETTTGTPTMMVRADLLTPELLFDETLSPLADRDFLMRWSQEYQVDTVAEVLLRAHRGRSDHLTLGANLVDGMHRLMHKYAADFDRNPKAAHQAHRRLAFLYFTRLNDLRGLRRHLLRALWVYPWRPKAWASLFCSLLGRRLFSLILSFQANFRVKHPSLDDRNRPA